MSSGSTTDQELSPSAAYLDQQNDDSPLSEMLDTLPPFVARGAIYLLLGLLVVGIAYCGISKIDVIETASATVVPEGRIKQVESDIDGTLMKIEVAEGQSVDQGDVLAVIESKEVGTYLSDLRTAQSALADVEAELKDIVPVKLDTINAEVKLLDTKIEGLQKERQSLTQKIEKEKAAFVIAEEVHEAEKTKYAEKIVRLGIEKENAESTLKVWNERFDADKTLRESGALSKFQFLSTQLSQILAKNEVTKTDSVLVETKQDQDITGKKFKATQIAHEQLMLGYADQSEKAKFSIQAAQDELAAKQHEAKLLELESKQKLNQVKFKFQQALEMARRNLPGVTDDVVQEIADGKRSATNQSLLRAPVNGVVGKLLVTTIGESVNRDQTILSLVPDDATLQAELSIPNHSMGLMKTGLDVKLKFEAFPYAEHGAIIGELTRIVPEAENESDTPPYYRAYCSMNQDYFRVEGQEVSLLPGMTATAEIVTESKSLLSFVLKPFLDLQAAKEAEK